MNTTYQSLSQIQSSLVRLCTQHDLDAYLKTPKASAPERNLANSLPLDRILIYAGNTYSKRVYLSALTFKLCSKALGAKTWERIIAGYWEGRQTNPARPLEALSELPAYMASLVHEDPSLEVWAEFADYELTVQTVSNLQHRISTNKRRSPKNPAESKLLPYINPTVKVKRFNYDVNGIAAQLTKGKCTRLLRKRLNEPRYVIFYLDPQTRSLKAQQVGRLAAEIVAVAQYSSAKLSNLFELIRLRLPSAPESVLIANFTTLIFQLMQAGIISAVLPKYGRRRKRRRRRRKKE